MDYANNPLIFIAVVVLIAIAIIGVQSVVAKKDSGIPIVGATPLNDNSPFPAAPEFQGISGRINASDSLSLQSLRGKVVLVDFWDYTCINCIRTIPHLNYLNENYAKDGLVIVGVHSPEFAFEKDYKNLDDAVKKFNIQYPVLQDNDFVTWRLYGNQYWPHQYLIDKNGKIRYDHIGEGAYEETEQQIVSLLKEVTPNVSESEKKPETPKTDFSKIATPEIYLGYDFARQNIGNAEGFKPDQIVHYTEPARLQPNIAYFSGDWKNNSDSMELVGDTGSVYLDYSAKNANIVAVGNSILFVQGFQETLELNAIGSDGVLDGNRFRVDVNEERLYNIVSAPEYGEKQIELRVQGKGFKLFTFTFG